MSTNRLARETSPYLQQHAANPVHWYAWGPEAFAAARESGKPVLLSIGYSACHWCHVMAHESFEDEATAALMNELFINIKVDREERPLVVVGEEHRERPAAGALGQHLLRDLVDAVDIRPFLAIHLDAHKSFVE